MPRFEAGDGRPRSDKRQRDIKLQKRVNEEEFAAFVDRAHAQGYGGHLEYLTAFILGDVFISKRQECDLVKLMNELSRQGTNINQIARAANEGRIKSISAEQMQAIQDAAEEVRSASAMIREALKR